MFTILKRNKRKKENELIRQLTEANSNLNADLEVANEACFSQAQEYEAAIKELGAVIEDRTINMKASRAKAQKLNSENKALKTFVKGAPGGEEFLNELRKSVRKTAAGKKAKK